MPNSIEMWLAPALAIVFGIVSGCTPAANAGFDVASFLLGYASNASRTLFDPGTYTELRPEFAAYFQDDIRVTR